MATSHLRGRMTPGGLPMAVLATGLVALSPFAIDMMLPSLPAMAVTFAAEPARVQLSVTMYLLAYAISQPVYGPLSDRFGRRAVLLVSLLLFSLTGLACVAAPNLEILIAARFAQGFMAGAAPVLARAVVRDVYDTHRAAKVLAYMSSAMALAPIVAPIFGGILETWGGWSSILAVLTGMGVLLFAATWVGLPETNRYLDRGATRVRSILANYGTLLTHRAYMAYSLTLGVYFGGFFAFITNSSFVLIDLIGVSPEVYGFCFGAVAFGFMVGAFLTGKLTSTWGLNRIIFVGAVISAVAGSVLAGASWIGWNSVLAVVAPMFVYALGGGMLMPSTMAGAIAPFPRMAGAASALLGFLQLSGATVYSLVIGALYDGTSLPMTTGIAAAGLGGLVIFVVMAPQRNLSTQDDSQTPRGNQRANPQEPARSTYAFPELQSDLLSAVQVALGDGAISLDSLDSIWAGSISGNEPVLVRLLRELDARLPIDIPSADIVNFDTFEDAVSYLDLRLNGIAQ